MHTPKIVFLFLNRNICCGYSKELSQWDGSFERPKHMWKLMGKKIFTILHSKILLILTYVITYEEHNLWNSIHIASVLSLVTATYRCSQELIVLCYQYNVIGPVKQFFQRKIVIILFIHQFKHVFWVLKRTISMRWFFWVPTTYVLVANEKKYFTFTHSYMYLGACNVFSPHSLSPPKLILF